MITIKLSPIETSHNFNNRTNNDIYLNTFTADFFLDCGVGKVKNLFSVTKEFTSLKNLEELEEEKLKTCKQLFGFQKYLLKILDDKDLYLFLSDIIKNDLEARECVRAGLEDNYDLISENVVNIPEEFDYNNFIGLINETIYNNILSIDRLKIKDFYNLDSNVDSTIVFNDKTKLVNKHLEDFKEPIVIGNVIHDNIDFFNEKNFSSLPDNVQEAYIFNKKENILKEKINSLLAEVKLNFKSGENLNYLLSEKKINIKKLDNLKNKLLNNSFDLNEKYEDIFARKKELEENIIFFEKTIQTERNNVATISYTLINLIKNINEILPDYKSLSNSEKIISKEYLNGIKAELLDVIKEDVSLNNWLKDIDISDVIIPTKKSKFSRKNNQLDFE